MCKRLPGNFYYFYIHDYNLIYRNPYLYGRYTSLNYSGVGSRILHENTAQQLYLISLEWSHTSGLLFDETF